MDNKTMEMLENLEDKIEGMKWLITGHFPLKKAGISSVINIIRKSSGILSKGFPGGAAFENKARKEWKINLLKRIS